MKENQPTLVFVFALLMAVLAAFILDIGIPPGRLIGYGVLLAVEAWAIANKRKGDTISEAFWELSSRPLVPWACGVLTTYFVMRGTIVHTAEIAALVGLQAHFFWQSDSVYERLRDTEMVAIAAVRAASATPAVIAVPVSSDKPAKES